MNTVFSRHECPLRPYGTVSGEVQFWVLRLLSATALLLNSNCNAVIVRGLNLNDIQVKLGRTYRR